MTWHGSVPFTEAGMNEEKYSLLKELAKDSYYWKSALDFVNGVSGRALSSLTLRQRNWMVEIITSLGERITTADQLLEPYYFDKWS